MKAQIYIESKNALLAGINNQGGYFVDFDPADLTPEQRQTLSECGIDSETGAYRTHYKDNYRKGDWGAGIVVPDLDALRAVLDARKAALDAKAAEKAAKDAEEEAQCLAAAAKWAASPPEDRVMCLSPTTGWVVRVKQYLPKINGREEEVGYIRKVAETNPSVKTALEDAESLAFWVNLDCEAGAIITRRKNELATAQEKAEKTAAAERRKAQLAAWVAEHGDDNMKERLAANLLPSAEVIDQIRAQAYAPLDAFPRYEKMKPSDVCEGYDDYDGTAYHDVEFDVEPSENLSAESFEHMKAIRAAIGDDAAIEPRDHSGRCDECDNTVYRVGFMVRIKVGELEFSREYASPGI